ncbi:hypothetical protein ACFORL_01235 [Legionella dresdenensis]|uniref:Transmembrane protein n=1 Tax=Legionella dresdenensis TaxID=450200 RepID=A0ABV8CBL6_9GAMM
MFNVAGFLTLIAATNYHPDQIPARAYWYGFLQFKDQVKAAATIGLFAVICSFMALAFPVMAIPAFWLYAVNSSLRCIAEYHKKRNPPINDPHFSSTKQKSSFYYSVCTATLSVVSATAMTIMILVPPAFTVTLVIACLICTALVITASYFWVNSTYGKHVADTELIEETYFKAGSKLALSPENRRERRPELEETAVYQPIFQKSASSSNIAPRADEEEPAADESEQSTAQIRSA